MSEPSERGLQAERTMLAHRRTQLATTVVSLMLVREAEPGFERALAFVVAAPCVVLAMLVVASRARELRLSPPVLSARIPILIVSAVGSLQILAAAVILT